MQKPETSPSLGITIDQIVIVIVIVVIKHKMTTPSLMRMDPINISSNIYLSTA
jgi:hypothetical protein